MKEVLLIKLGEMVLKGQNRRVFDQALLKNIKQALRGTGAFDVRYAQSTVYVIPEDAESDMDLAEERIGKVFGVISYVRACTAEKTVEGIQKAAAEYLRAELETVKTFKVESKRADKQFPLTSPELSCEVGGYLLEQYPHLTVDVHHPDLVVRAEVRYFH